LVNFDWQWTGDPIPPQFGFEVRTWLPGQPPLGVHDSVRDSQEGNILSLGPDRYRLKVNDIRYAAGVKGREGIYNWTVLLVCVNPIYAETGRQANSARFAYAPLSGSGR
jgi:hypothetical protein